MFNAVKLGKSSVRFEESKLEALFKHTYFNITYVAV